MIRSLQQASGDVVVVATVPTFKPYGDIREYAVKMFENGGRGIGQKGKDNGLLVLPGRQGSAGPNRSRLRPRAVHHRRLRRRASRQVMAPEFRQRRLRRRALVGGSRDHRRIARDETSRYRRPAGAE